MNCKFCENKIEQNSAFCPCCGEKQIEVQNQTDSNSLIWEKFISENKHILNDDTINFEIIKNEDFYIEGETDYDKLCKMWLNIYGNAITNDFFMKMHRKHDLDKGIDLFCSVFVTQLNNYQYFYQNSAGFRFFIDNTPKHIISIFEKDQKVAARADRFLKICRVARTVGFSLITDKLVDSTFELFKNKDFEQLAFDKSFNSYMYAIGYSDYWK